MLQAVRDRLTPVVDVLLPRVAAEAEELLAVGDWRPESPGDYCPRCGESKRDAGVSERGCPLCVRERWPWRELVRLGAYVEPLNEWIHAMKFGGQWAWGRWFGQRLAEVETLKQLDASRLLVCSTPMHWRRRWGRGFNQAQVIAASLAKNLGGVRHVEVLRRVRPTAPQTSVHWRDRPANVRAAFALEAVDLAGLDVLLVDDVKTTGSTLRGCAKLLHDAGAASITAVVVAVADRHKI